MSETHSVEEYMNVVRNAEKDLVIHDGRLGPSVIRGDTGSNFAINWSVQQSTGPEDVELSGSMFLSESDVRDHIVESLEHEIEIEIIDPDAESKPWVYNMGVLAETKY